MKTAQQLLAAVTGWCDSEPAAAEADALGGQHFQEMMATIRAAVIGDEQLLVRLNTFVQDLHVQRRPDHFKQTQLPELAAWYKSLLGTTTARMWIAEEQGRPVGYVLAMLQHVQASPFTQPRDWCEIDQIAVDPNYRRRGIARSLVLEAVAQARAEGIERVEAASWSFNDETHQLFRRLGFTPKTARFELKSPA